MELQEVIVEQKVKEQEAEVITRLMEEVEDKYREDVNKMQDTLQEHKRAVARCETKQVAVVKEVPRL